MTRSCYRATLPLLVFVAACAGLGVACASTEPVGVDRPSGRDSGREPEDSGRERPDTDEDDTGASDDADTVADATDDTGSDDATSSDAGDPDAAADAGQDDVADDDVVAPTGCCVEQCDGADCSIVAGPCEPICGGERMVVGATCAGCVGADTEGVCAGGLEYVCNAENACVAASCGGTNYFCTQVAGQWEWRTSGACDDGDPCTSGDACNLGECTGSAYVCEDRVCGADRCLGNAFVDAIASCDRVCDGAGGCLDCECTETTKSCDVGAGNECCAPSCDPVTGCATVAGSCGTDVCTDPNTLRLAGSCTGCGAADASGVCSAPREEVCDAASGGLCRQVACGGATYSCTNVGGVWQWRSAAGCDDGNLCTYGDSCSSGTCRGTTVDCSDTTCVDRTCNGTATCTSTTLVGQSCNDANACTIGDSCNASGVCVGGGSAASCGDGVCNCGETNANCAADCPIVLPTGACTTGGQNRRGCGNARTISRAEASATWSSGSQNTCGSSESDRFSGECGGLFDVGYEHVYAIYVRAGERVTATLGAGTNECANDEDFHSRLKMRFNADAGAGGAASCPSFVGCWGGPAEDQTWTTARDYDAPSDGWVFVIVDGGASGWGEHRGYYTLSVVLSRCATANCGC